MAEAHVHKDIAAEQAKIVGEALKSARIDIVGGDNNFFNRLVNSITTGKSVDRMVDNSAVLADVRQALLGKDADESVAKIRQFVSRFGVTSEDVKNLSVSALVMQMMDKADKKDKGVLGSILETVKQSGLADLPAKDLGLSGK